MKKIGLFGGTFDPIHNGHLHIARAFADEVGLDMVVFLPAGDPYHKDSAQTAARHRFAMTELAAGHLVSGTARLAGAMTLMLTMLFGAALGRSLAGTIPVPVGVAGMGEG